MENEHFYHMFANGDDAKNFIVTESDYFAAFNLIGVCAANCDAKVVSFSIEDSHPHILLFGHRDECVLFKQMYQSSYCHHIVRTRGNLDGVRLYCELYPVNSEDYLRNVAAYTIIQPTKDGKKVMPFDYVWGSGALYFRSANTISVWQTYNSGIVKDPVSMSSITERVKRNILYSRKKVPDSWLVCNGFLLPSNYIDVRIFEEIYGSFNCYRVFLGGSRKRDEAIIEKMSKARGILMEDLEAHRVSAELCYLLFKKKSARWIKPGQRLTLAQNLRRSYNMTIRQIATVTRLSEIEVRKYIK